MTIQQITDGPSRYLLVLSQHRRLLQDALQNSILVRGILNQVHILYIVTIVIAIRFYVPLIEYNRANCGNIQQLCHILGVALFLGAAVEGSIIDSESSAMSNNHEYLQQTCPRLRQASI